MNEAYIKACRAEQSSRVMPLIGGLLDAWDDLPNDIKEDTEILHFAEHVQAIDNAMEQAAGDREPEANPNAGNIAGSISAIGSVAWTKTPPAMPGHYWVRFGSKQGMTVLEVENWHGKMQCYYYQAWRPLGDAFYWRDVEWWPYPITPPLNGQAQALRPEQ